MRRSLFSNIRWFASEQCLKICINIWCLRKVYTDSLEYCCREKLIYLLFCHHFFYIDYLPFVFFFLSFWVTFVYCFVVSLLFPSQFCPFPIIVINLKLFPFLDCFFLNFSYFQLHIEFIYSNTTFMEPAKILVKTSFLSSENLCQKIPMYNYGCSVMHLTRNKTERMIPIWSWINYMDGVWVLLIHLESKIFACDENSNYIKQLLGTSTLTLIRLIPYLR